MVSLLFLFFVLLLLLLCSALDREDELGKQGQLRPLLEKVGLRLRVQGERGGQVCSAEDEEGDLSLRL